MNNARYSKFSWFFYLSFLLVFQLASCKKDDLKLRVPQIVDNNITDGKDSITAGESLTLHPVLQDRTNTTYQWKINGQQAGADSVFTFTTDSAGDYTIDYSAINSSGNASFQYFIHVWGKYENGILLINEGWFGQDNGSVNFYRYGKDTIEQMAYKKENPDKELGVTTEYAAIFNGKLYIISKQGPMVVADAKSLKETGRIESLPADGRAFVGLDNSTGLISASDGIYRVNLSPLTIGTKIPDISGDVGGMKKVGDYIFAISQSDGLIILNAGDFSVVKKIAGITQGLTATADGNIWVAGGSSLVSVNPGSLDTTLVTLPFSLGDPWFAWNDGTVTASTKDNSVFIARTMPWGAGGNEIYRYTGAEASLQTPFAVLPANQEFYGCGVRYDSAKDELAVTAVQSGYGMNYSYNRLYVYDANTGNRKKNIYYEYFYFPALLIFN